VSSFCKNGWEHYELTVIKIYCLLVYNRVQRKHTKCMFISVSTNWASSFSVSICTSAQKKSRSTRSNNLKQIWWFTFPYSIIPRKVELNHQIQDVVVAALEKQRCWNNWTLMWSTNILELSNETIHTCFLIKGEKNQSVDAHGESWEEIFSSETPLPWRPWIYYKQIAPVSKIING
jgi:hypothetical protein